MAETSINLNDSNDGRRYDWRINHEGIRQCILVSLKEDKKFPTYKEISVATGLSIETICLHAKSLDLVEIRTQARLLGPDILLRQALSALNSGDHNEAKTYFKLNYDWAEKSETKLSGEVNLTFEQKRAAIETEEQKLLAELKVEGVELAEFEEIVPNEISENGESESEMPQNA